MLLRYTVKDLDYPEVITIYNDGVIVYTDPLGGDYEIQSNRIVSVIHQIIQDIQEISDDREIEWNNQYTPEELREIDDKLSIIHRIVRNHVDLMENNGDMIET